MKRGQMKISFSMIVSIILIIMFISFAFYAITKFLGVQRTVQFGQFVDDSQNDIDKMWKSSQGSQEKEYFLPSKVKHVCFVDFSNSASHGEEEIYNELNKGYYGEENLIFYPVGSAEGLDSILIKHIDLEKITQDKNPFCIENINNKVKITMKKSFEEALVTIE